MAIQVVMGATLKCSFGATPSSLVVVPKGSLIAAKVPLAASIMDHVPMVNILPFGVCASLAFPTTASATTAAFGVLTPTPCIPATVAPWKPGSPKVLINKSPALNNTSTCNCIWGGVITVMSPGQFTVSIP
ncbi:MAG: DUF4280 domain-containing protein [Cyanobacteria bacterium J06638_28]